MLKILALTSLLFLLNCSDPASNNESLDFSSSAPITLKVGDTSDVFMISKTSFDERGRSSTNSKYKDFSLVIADTTICRVVNLNRITGAKPGETTLNALDNVGHLQSSPITIKVVAKP